MVWRITPSNLLVDDPDALTYLAAVEAADGQELESGVRLAVNAFVKGCKADGIWTAFEQCGIFCGARTRAASAIPLVKPTGNANPTFHGTIGGWSYNRKTGLAGNGTDNYVNTNYVIPSGNQNNCHISVNKSTSATGGSNPYYIGTSTSGFGTITGLGSGSVFVNTGTTALGVSGAGFHGATRSVSTSVSVLRAGQPLSVATNNTSATPPTAPVFLNTLNNGGTPGATQWSSAPLTFYSAGKNINLELLSNRVANLMNAVAIAIP